MPRRLTEYFLLCIVLRVRKNHHHPGVTANAGGRPFDGRSDGVERRQQMGSDTVEREDAKRPTSGCRFRRKPTRVAATHPQDEGQPTTHLENCTGKKLISAKEIENECGRFQSEADVRDQNTNQIGYNRFSIVLGKRL